jgi:uncharacterized membrane protein
MGFFFLIWFGLLILFFISLVLPWVQRGRIQELKKNVDMLKSQVAWLIAYTKENGAPVPEEWEKQKEKASSKPPALVLTFKTDKEQPPKKAAAAAKVSEEKIISITLEQKIASSLPVWIGGIALALAGVFMVKYSIETGLLSPAVRLMLGSLFGIVLLLVGNWIHSHPGIANSKRISQALSGAGIADLYVCLFAATSLYNLIPSFTGFVGMAVVTAVAVVLSLKQGPSIALLGMVGGFLTPGLIGSDQPNAQLLFIYLYFLLAGFFIVIRQKKWWPMSIPVVLGAFCWVIFWLETAFVPADGLWLGLFLIALCITVVLTSKKAMEEGTVDQLSFKGVKISSGLNYLSLGGAVLLMSVIATKTNFGEMEWGLFGFLSAGGIVLSFYNEKMYGFVPWLAMAINVILLTTWVEADPVVLASTILAFGLLFTFSSYWLMWKSPHSLPWGLMTGISSFVYYMLAYAKYHNWLANTFFTPQAWYTDVHLWGFLSLGLFLLCVLVIIQVLNFIPTEDKNKQKLLTIFTLTGAAFLSIGLTLELDQEFLTLALATEILVISWLNCYVNIKVLRPLAGALAIIFGVLLVPKLILQILLLSNTLISTLQYLPFDWHISRGNEPFPSSSSALWFGYFQDHIPSVGWSFLHLGLPALMFIVSSYLFRKEKDTSLARVFEVVAISLVAVMLHYLTRHAFHVGENLLFAGSSFTERGVMTTIYFLYGLACLWVGNFFKREAVCLSGFILICFALFRVLYFDLLFYNPLLSHQEIGKYPIFNALALPFGFSMLWIVFAKIELSKVWGSTYVLFLDVCLFLLAFFFVSFNVPHFYHGTYLDSGITTNAEVYTYSAAWLLMGIALLFFGTLRKDKALRVASLAFIVVSIGKVFLYDASELTGLFRVFSFLGLGISLLGLSWFYTRFVFNKKEVS